MPQIINNIQIARGIAASIVILAHANAIVDSNLFNGFLIIGWCGVDFFFVLSGFIIYHANSGKFGIRSEFVRYIFKRFIRIYPIYWIYFLMALALYAVTLLVIQKNTSGFDDVSHIGIIKNFLINTLGWNGIPSTELVENFLLLPTDVSSNKFPLLPPAWTLTYEILFYIFFGAAIITSKRIAAALVATWMMLILFGHFGYIKLTSNNLVFHTLINSHNLEFLFGCAAAWILSKYRDSISIKISISIVTLGIILLTCSWINAYKNFTWFARLEFIQFGIPFFLIVFGLAAFEAKRTTPIKSLRQSALFIGNASYSLYLTHFTVIQFCAVVGAKIFNPASIYVFLAAIVASFAVGCSLYVYIERPLMQWLSRKPPVVARGKLISG